jgi:hypothetical protein
MSTYVHVVLEYMSTYVYPLQYLAQYVHVYYKYHRKTAAGRTTQKKTTYCNFRSQQKTYTRWLQRHPSAQCDGALAAATIIAPLRGCPEAQR